MKHNHNHDNGHNAGPQLMPVLFEFSHPTAITVCVAATFDRWQSEAKTLHPTGGDHWWKETPLRLGTYEYCQAGNGPWIPDSSARKTVLNSIGERKSALKVAGLPEAARPAGAGKSA